MVRNRRGSSKWLEEGTSVNEITAVGKRTERQETKEAGLADPQEPTLERRNTDYQDEQTLGTTEGNSVECDPPTWQGQPEVGCARPQG